MFIVAPIVCGCFCLNLLVLLCSTCTVLCVISSFSLIQLGKRAGCFTVLSFGRHVAVIDLCFLLTVPWVDLQCVILGFPSHTHLHFVPIITRDFSKIFCKTI